MIRDSESSLTIADTSEQTKKAPPVDASLHGSVLVLIQFDVCEEIRLDKLREIFGARTLEQPTLKHPAPGYVRYQRPPVVEPIDALILESGERLEGQIKFYDYGVALVKPYPDWLSEDYFIFHVREISGCPSANELVSSHGARIAQIVRGETAQLSEGEQNEILQSRISYYPNDLTVISWNAAFLYDSATGAETAIQLLEYANSQLLEFRHYDEFLTRKLESVYASFDEGTGMLARWRLARAATKLHTVLLDVNELTEHADNAIKFLSDMFSARLYKLAASKVGVPDYKDLVTQKVQTAEELYRFMVDQFNQSRAFVLELMVVIILIIELVYFFRGKPI
jgi:hypothetical protein